VDPRRATKQLERLEKLWSNGRISETEYLEQRQKIMESMTDEQWEQDRPHPVPRDRKRISSVTRGGRRYVAVLGVDPIMRYWRRRQHRSCYLLDRRLLAGVASAF